MKKRLLSLMLCLVMALSLVPMTAYAVDDYGVVVGGTRITSDNCNDVFGDGTVSYKHNAEYNRGTLTLNGANITTYYKDTANNRTVGIYSAHDLTVYIGQEGARVDLHNLKCSGASYGIYVDGKLTFYTDYTTPDPMTVISAAGSGSNFGAYATGDIVIDSNWGVVGAFACLDADNFSRPGYGMAVGISHKISIESGHLYAMSYYGAATNVMPVLNDYYNDVIEQQYVFKGSSSSGGMQDIQPTSSPGGLMQLKVQRMFPDYGLWRFMMDRFDKDGSHYLDEEERNAVTEISGTTTATTRSAIGALEGLEYLPNLTTIDCHNELIESADLTQCPQLEKLNLNSNNLTKLDVSKCPNLTELECNYNQLTSLDVSNNTKLKILSCYENPIKSLDVSMCPDLEKLDCASLGSSTLETLTLGQKNALKELCCPSMALKSVDVTGCPNLEGLDSGYASGGVIDLSKNPQLKSLHLYGYKGNKLDLTHNTKLESLSCSQDSNLTSLDLSKCPNLKDVQIPSNGLTSLDLSNNTKLKMMYCQNNPLTSINVSKCSALEYLNVNNCKLTTLNVNNNPNLRYLFCTNNNLTALTIGNKPNLLKIDCYGNKLQYVDLSQTHIGSDTASDVYRAYVGNQQNDGMITVYTTKALMNTLKSYFNLHSEDHNSNVMVENVANYVCEPAISALTNGSANITVKWSKVAGAAGYQVYRKAGSGSWTLAKTITSGSTVSWSDTKATSSGTKYQYKVRAYKTVDGTKFYSAYSTVKTKYFVAQPKISSITNTSTGITVKWGKITGATAYRVYRKVGTGDWKLLKTVTGTSYTNTSLTNGSKYQYKIVAVKTVGSSNYTSAASAVKTMYRLSRPTISSATNVATKSIKVKWNSNSKASGYQVKYVKGTTAKTVTVKGASSLTKTLSSLTKDATYKVYVRSYKTVSGTNYYSAWSAYKSVKVAK